MLLSPGTVTIKPMLCVPQISQELLSLRLQNLKEASFEEKVELIARMGVKVIPAEDLKTRRIYCRLNLDNIQKKGGENGLTKVTFGGPSDPIAQPQIKTFFEVSLVSTE